MRNAQHLRSKHRTGLATTDSLHGLPSPGMRDALITATVEALDHLAAIVSKQCHSHPDSFSEAKITAYALALIQLRECAGAAGIGRLMNACDALAVTVSRLIDDPGCASSEKCAALKRFVVHAQEMIQMATGPSKRHALPVTDAPAHSGRVSATKIPAARSWNQALAN
jgi:hypothetical protein